MLPKPIDFNLFTKDTFPCATVLKQASPRCVSSCLNPWLFFAHSQRGSLSINSANIVNGRCRYRTATRRFVYRIFMEMENMADRRSDCGFSSFPPSPPLSPNRLYMRVNMRVYVCVSDMLRYVTIMLMTPSFSTPLNPCCFEGHT